MPLAVTHVITTIILVDLYRDYIAKKKYITMYTLLVAGIAGLLPDIDVPINWITGLFSYTFSHGGITHTPLFGLIFLIPAFIFYYKKKHKLSMYFFVISFGILFHLFLDFTLRGGAPDKGIMLFWPISSQAYKLHLLSGFENALHALDAFILLAWLFHEEVKHKIRDFI